MKEKMLNDNEASLVNLNRQLGRISSANAEFERIELDLKQAVRYMYIILYNGGQWGIE